jgi:hypothetical protein
MAYDEAMAHRIRELLKDEPGLTEKKGRLNWWTQRPL